MVAPVERSNKKRPRDRIDAGLKKPGEDLYEGPKVGADHRTFLEEQTPRLLCNGRAQ